MTSRREKKCQKVCLATFEKNLKWPLFDTKVFTVSCLSKLESFVYNTVCFFSCMCVCLCEPELMVLEAMER